jgi:BirA family biotin operon repressor/biotin-[acetyl-CoA-carboxylase] ligase
MCIAATGKSFDLNEVLEGMFARIMAWYQKLKDGQVDMISVAYHKTLYRRTGFHNYKDEKGEFRASIESVSPDGFLHLRTEDGRERRYAFKEVAFCAD